MTEKKRAFLPIAALAAVTLAVSACGGGSSTSGGTDPVDPTPPPTSACPGTDATSHAACVAEKKMAMEDAKKALDAAKADQSSTQAQLAAAQKAYDDAMKAHTDAVAASNTYAAMQPPTYDLAAMVTAIGEPGTLPLTVDNTTNNEVAGGMVTDEDADGNNTYAKATWPVGNITGFAESVWEKSAAEVTDSVVVYTNIEKSRVAKYNTYYAPSGGVSRAGDAPAAPAGWAYRTWAGVSSVAAGQTNNENDANKPTVITLAETVTDATRSLFDLPHGLTRKNQTNRFVDDTDTTDVDESQPKIKGTFDGVAGTFACASSCSLASGADGKLSTLGGTWTFTANSKDATVAGALEDADYLDFGYWVQTDESGDGTVYMVDTFIRGQTPSSASNVTVTDLEGSATYKGGAAGLYTKRAFAAGGDGAVMAAGRFTADAELVANFSGSDVAASKHDSITGTIKNFMDGDEVIDAAWSLELKKATISGTGAITGTGWSGMFYGAVAIDTDTTTDGAQSMLPSGVAGEFTGGFNNGDVIGSFGATKN